MLKNPNRAAQAFKALVEFSDSVLVEDDAFNPQPEPSKVNSGRFGLGSTKGTTIRNKYWTAQFAEAHRLARELELS